MIAIVNVDKNPRRKGDHLYSLRINNIEITTFYHKRESSLSVCLRMASKAAKEAERNKLIETFNIY